MERNHRLVNDDEIELSEVSTGATVTFKINDVLSGSDGSSVICYSARRLDTGRSIILKEFYPLVYSFNDDGKSFSLVRNDNNQLIPSSNITEAKEKFLDLRNTKFNTSKKIIETINSSQGENILKTFIPSISLYRGTVDNDGNWNSTFYYVVDQPQLITFESVCEDIKKNPQKDSEYKLLVILKSIQQLTICIKTLHEEGFCHRDICPSNFGFAKRSEDYLTETISLFDIDCFMYFKDKKTNEFVGTPGFMAPEVESKTVQRSVSADLYSIGATLYYALTGEHAQAIEDHNNNQIREEIEQSKLVKASTVNNNPYLLGKICELLYKSLNRDVDNRYKNSDELLKDIRMALFFMLPPDRRDIDVDGLVWELTRTDYTTEQKQYYKFLMLYQLFKVPLYNPDRSDDNNTIDVTLVGFDRYGYDFLDAVLQFSQCIKETVNTRVYVNVDRFESVDLYLGNRPALKDFFRINKFGTPLNPVKEFNDTDTYSYGTVEFINFTGNVDPNHIVRNEDNRNYIFVTLGNDKKNYEYATQLSDVVLNVDKCITYIATMNEAVEDYADCVVPIFVNKFDMNDEKSEFYLIEERSKIRNFLHDRGIYVDIEKKMKDYHKDNEYKHNACVSGVLSLKYMLHRIGVSRDMIHDPEGTSVEFERVHDNNRNELIYIEHKRWVVDKLCDGWSPLPIDEFDVYTSSGENKDTTNKRHSCIVRSSINNNVNILKDQYGDGINVNVDKWDGTEVIPEMDELDRVSLTLHRSFKRAANNPNRINDIKRNLSFIGQEVSCDPEKYKPFSDWQHYILNLLEGKNPVDRYGSLRDAFFSAIEKDDDEVKKKAKTVDDDVKCIVQYNKFLNYKYEDEKIFDNLPFILNYSLETVLVRDLYFGPNKEKLLNNYASIMIANPAAVVYCVNLTATNANVDAICNVIDSINNTFKKHFIRTQMKFLLFYNNNDIIRHKKENLITALNSNNRQFTVIGSVLIHNSYNESRESALKVLNGNNNYLVEDEDYSFNYKTRHFDKSPRLKYITKHLPSLAVADVLNITNIEYAYDVPTYYESFKTLWSFYADNNQRSNWNAFCSPFNIDRDSHVKQLLNMKVKEKHKDEGNYDSCSFTIPSVCQEGVFKIMEFLHNNRIIKWSHNFTHQSINDLKLDYKVLSTCNEKLKNLLSEPQFLINDKALYTLKQSSHYYVKYKNLRVNLNEYEEVADKNYPREIIEEILKEAKIIDFINDEGFTCTSFEAYDLISAEGRLLEILVYYALKTSGMFDDVATSISVNWDDYSRNELDLIVTKGFRCAVIECKARSMIGNSEYRQLVGENIDHPGPGFRLSVPTERILVAMCNPDNDTADSELKNKVKTIYWLSDKPKEFAQRIIDALGWND